MDKSVKTLAMLLAAAFLGAMLSQLTINVAIRDTTPPPDVRPAPVQPKPVAPVVPGFDPSKYKPTMGQQ
jgi:hypothetical protein